MQETSKVLKRLKIAIDYDNTWTADPFLFYTLAQNALDRGHEVYIVTMRNEDLDAIDDPYDFMPEVIYCDGHPKKLYCWNKYGLLIDIWVDDTPEGIHMGSEFTTEMLTEWRNNDKSS